MTPDAIKKMRRVWPKGARLRGDSPKNKLNAKKKEVDNIMFASTKEANRYCYLKQLQQAGVIRELEIQPMYVIEVNDVHICKYTADFRYRDNEYALVVEDVKGQQSGAAYQAFRKNQKLMLAVHGIEVIEI